MADFSRLKGGRPTFTSAEEIMREQLNKVLGRFGKAALTIGFSFMLMVTLGWGLSQPVAAAPNSACVTYGGKPLCPEGTSSAAAAIFNTVVGQVRQIHASAPASETVDMGDVQPLTLNQTCFGNYSPVTGGGFLLKETKHVTDKSQGRYDARLPKAGEHGDYLPWGIVNWFSADRQLACNELIADISFRYVVSTTNKPLHLLYQFRLYDNPNESDPNAEYNTLSSNGGLGLFVTSMNPITINAESLAGRACFDCFDHTTILTTTSNHIYGPGELSFIDVLGDAERDTTLDMVYILGLPKGDFAQVYSVDMYIPAHTTVVLWFGQANMPGVNK